jgi:quercetin dioxygenase-like cupin family protein
MSPISRPLTGPHLIFDFADHLAELRRDDAYRRSGRVGRTLAKQGPLRLTLVALAEGVQVETHLAESPMTLQPLEGRIRYRVAGETFELEAGQILYFGPGDAQDIRALEETALLLTITAGEGAAEVAKPEVD